ncbi:hypothetical protein BDY19DRAFT_1045973 [Irpex rosettiformis]|uniref:Uncharacterized protein n=1 Tax=Irpex rosettiformis TaxID=378272 RepID=A0ACB8UEX4_9APHY|nr:hypothetical protein BDY19DRAFT_1045973 [Irpex rosettiformis]
MPTPRFDSSMWRHLPEMPDRTAFKKLYQVVYFAEAIAAMGPILEYQGLPFFRRPAGETIPQNIENLRQNILLLQRKCQEFSEWILMPYTPGFENSQSDEEPTIARTPPPPSPPPPPPPRPRPLIYDPKDPWKPTVIPPGVLWNPETGIMLMDPQVTCSAGYITEPRAHNTRKRPLPNHKQDSSPEPPRKRCRLA